MTYQELKAEQTKKVSKIIERNKVFFAFSQKQYLENKTPAENGIVAIGSGGYLPSENKQQYRLDMIELDHWFKKEVLECKEEAIDYELGNYECYYTHDLEPVYDLFFDVFSEDDIMNIYKQNLCKQ
jgi:hypothetical protein